MTPIAPPFRNPLILLLILLVVRLVLNAVAPIADPSEARYALICRIMTDSGDYLRPTLIHNGAPTTFDGKPPLYFQLGGLAGELFGPGKFAVRLPAFLFSVALLIATWATTRRLASAKAAAAATLLLGFSVIFYVFSGLAMTDMALAFSVAGAVFSYMLFDRASPGRSKKWSSVAFFAFLGLGMLAKGPVAILLAGMPVFLYVLINRRWADLKRHAWICGPVVFCLVAGPWYWKMQQADPGFLEYFFVNENFKRFLFKEYGDKFGSGREFFRGVSILWLLLCNLPAVLLLALPLAKRETRKALIAKEQLRSPLVGMSLLAFLSITLFWCLTSRVLIYYLIPTIPFVSIWIATRLDEFGMLDAPLFRKAVGILFPAICGCVAAGQIGAIAVAPQFIDEMPEAAYRAAEKTSGTSDFYFFYRSPYSAYFVLGDRVRMHPEKEKAAECLKKSKDCVLLVKRRDRDRLPERLSRDVLYESGTWIVYGPEKSAETSSPRN